MKRSVRMQFLIWCAVVAVASASFSCRDAGTQAGDEQRISIIIPPFVNTTVAGNRDDYDYLSIGIADELSNRLAYSDRFDVIDPALLVEKITLRQLVGGAKDEKALVDAFLGLKAEYAVMGTVSLSVDRNVLTLSARALRTADGKTMAEATETGEASEWNHLRGLLASRLAAKLGVKLSGTALRQLAEADTREFAAFRENYIGKLYYYKSLEAGINKKEDDVRKFKQLSLLHYSKAIARDVNYQTVRKNYVQLFDFKKLLSTKEEKSARIQGRLNEMTIFGIANQADANKHIAEWAAKNRVLIKSMINGLPDEYRLEIQGHTDSAGSPALAAARAKQVYDALRGVGVFDFKMSHMGYGSLKRIPWIHPADKSNNRVTFAIVSVIK